MGLYLMFDALIILIILLRTYRGAVRGFFLALSSAVAIIGGLVGGLWIADRYSASLLRSVLMPWVDKMFGPDIQVPDSVAKLTELLEHVKLPAFLTTGVPQEAMSRASEAGSGLLGAAKELIALRGAEIIVFVCSFFLIFAVIKLLLHGLNLLFRLPVIGTINRILGALFGGVSGVLVAAVLLAAAYYFFPSLSVSGGVLSPESLEKTYITKYFFDYIFIWL